MKLFYSIVFCLMMSAVLGQVRISGQIVDSTSETPLIGASIYLLTDFRTGTVSDVDGQFKLELSIDQMEDSVLITYVGYEEVVCRVDKLPGQIRLVEKKFEMTTVEVVAEPLIAEEFKSTRISKLDIYKNPAAKADALLAVTSMPSATTTDESASVSLRGSSPLETGIFINGVPVYDAVRFSQLNGIGTFSLFNTSLIKDVMVFPGNPPLEFGNTTSGVVSLETNDRILKSNSNSVIVSPASLGYQRSQRIGKNHSVNLFTNYQPSAALKALNHKSLDRLKKFNSVDFGVYAYGRREGFNYKTYSYALSENYRYHYQHPTFLGSFDQNRQRAFNASTLEWSAGKGVLKWNQGYSLSNASYAYSSADIDVNNRSVFQGISFHRSFENWQYKLGVSFDRRFSNVSGESFIYNYAIAPEHPTKIFESQTATTTTEAFGYAKYYLTEKLIIGGGLRKNIILPENHNYLSIQINTSYQWSEKWKVIASAGTYHKYGILENQGEDVFIKSRQVSLDLFYYNLASKSSLSFFLKDNKISGNKKRVHGLEYFAEYLFFNHLLANISFTWLSDDGEMEVDQYDLSYFIKTNLSYSTTNNWTISLNGLFRDGSPYLEVNNANYDASLDSYMPISYLEMRYPDYHIINAAISKLIPINDTSMFVVFASINNVTNKENIRSYSYNFDYSKKSNDLYGERVIYMGIQMNF